MFVMKRRRRKNRIEKRSNFDVKKFLATIIVIALPITVFCIAANLTLRLGEIYEYSLDSSEILENTTIVTDKDSVANTFASFMQHRTPELSLIESVEYDPQEIFSRQDKDAMAGLRWILDILLAIGAVGFFATAVCYFFLIRWRVKDIFMNRFKVSVVVFAGILVANAMTILVPSIRNAVYGKIIGTKFPDGDNLVLLLSDSFPLQVTVAETLLASILMSIVAYITWTIAGRRKLFRGF